MKKILNLFSGILTEITAGALVIVWGLLICAVLFCVIRPLDAAHCLNRTIQIL